MINYSELEEVVLTRDLTADDIGYLDPEDTPLTRLHKGVIGTIVSILAKNVYLVESGTIGAEVLFQVSGDVLAIAERSQIQ